MGPWKMAYLETKLKIPGPHVPRKTMILGTKSRSSWSWYPSINVIQIVHMKVSYSFLFPTPVDMRGLCAGSFAYIPSNYNIIHLYIQHACMIYIYIYPKHTWKGFEPCFFECCYGLMVAVQVDSTQSICGQPLTVMLPASLALISS